MEPYTQRFHKNYRWAHCWWFLIVHSLQAECVQIHRWLYFMVLDHGTGYPWSEEILWLLKFIKNRTLHLLPSFSLLFSAGWRVLLHCNIPYKIWWIGLFQMTYRVLWWKDDFGIPTKWFFRSQLWTICHSLKSTPCQWLWWPSWCQILFQVTLLKIPLIRCILWFQLLSNLTMVDLQCFYLLISIFSWVNLSPTDEEG